MYLPESNRGWQGLCWKIPYFTDQIGAPTKKFNGFFRGSIESIKSVYKFFIFENNEFAEMSFHQIGFLFLKSLNFLIKSVHLLASNFKNELKYVLTSRQLQ